MADKLITQVLLYAPLVEGLLLGFPNYTPTVKRY